MLSRPEEDLVDHKQRAENNFYLLTKHKNIDKILNNIIDKICKNEGLELVKGFLYALKEDVLIAHDDGKENQYFQSYVGNEAYKSLRYNNENKQHSIISAYYFLANNKDNIKDLLRNLEGVSRKEKRDIENKLIDLVVGCSSIIYKHHGDLKVFTPLELTTKIVNLNKRYPEVFFKGFNEEALKYYKQISPIGYKDGFLKYVFIKYLYSVLVTCDYLAVYEFYKGQHLDLNLIKGDKLRDFKSKFENNAIVSGIRKYENGENPLVGIDKYRTEMFLESEKNLLKNYYKNIFYLEAPTGSGKSITSINLALLLMNETFNKIYYVAPYINIINQAEEDIKEYIGTINTDVVMVNSKEEIVVEDINGDYEDMEVSYEKEYMNSLMLNYPVSVISHVRFFDMLFGVRRKQSMMLALMPNSVIIIDEIQSYKNNLWINIIRLLKKYSELLNIKVIIMSATLPKLEKLLEDTDYVIPSLITNRENYYNFFNNRLNYDFLLLDKEFEPRNLYEKIHEVIENDDKHRILIGLIKRSTCDEVYNEMLKYKEQGFEVYKIKGNTSIIEKEDIIRKLKEKSGEEYALKKVILVATQCIEAGVDIDMNIGFKNISVLDSDYQFCGRIERNFKNKGIVYFFRWDRCGKIYDEDYRVEKTLVNKEWRELFINHNFHKFYEENYKWLLREKEKSYSRLKEFIDKLDYLRVSEEMKLITGDVKINLLLDFNYRDKEGKVLRCSDLIAEYKVHTSNVNISYAEKEVKLSRLKKSFDRFTYEASIYDEDKIPVAKKLGNYLLVENAGKFFENTIEGYVVDESSFNYDKLINQL